MQQEGARAMRGKEKTQWDGAWGKTKERKNVDEKSNIKDRENAMRGSEIYGSKKESR